MIPILDPILVALGTDMIWFGVLLVVVLEMGLITPPVGLNVFIIKGLAPEVPMQDIFKGIIPFFLMQVLTVIILMAFPILATFLPSLR